MALVHVIAREIFITKCAKHAHPADSQQDFLAQTVVRIAAIESASEVAVPLGVGRKIGIEKIDRHNETTDTFNVVAPAAKLDAAILQWHGDARGFFLEKIFHFPDYRLFCLGAVFGKMLRKESSAVKERNGNHGQAKVRGGADGVSSENAQAAAVARHGVLE